MTSSSKKHVVILGGKDEVFIAIAAMGLRITLIQYEEMITEVQKELAAEFFTVNSGQEMDAVNYVSVVAGQHNIDAVVSFYPTWLMTAALIGEKFNIPSNPLLPVRTSHHKHELREQMDRCGIQNLKWSICKTPGELRLFYEYLNKPIVVKPLSGGGSAGVIMVQKDEEIDEAFKYARTVPDWANMENFNGVLAEEYIPGDEYSVETVSRDGVHQFLGVVQKITTGAPHFIEVGHSFPACLDLQVASQIEKVTIDLLNCMGQQQGPCHTEVKIYDGKVYVIETQTRFGGDQIWELIELCTGINSALETVAHLTGSNIISDKNISDAAAVVHFMPPKGTISEVNGLKEAANFPGVKRLHIKDVEGKKYTVASDSSGRIGYCLATGETAKDAYSNCVRATSIINIVTENGVQKVRC